MNTALCKLSLRSLEPFLIFMFCRSQTVKARSQYNDKEVTVLFGRREEKWSSISQD
jgi:hypothetical protein